MTETNPSPFVVLISANAEWRAVRKLFQGEEIQLSPFGEWFTSMQPQRGKTSTIFFHGGWGKIAAAGSTQYVIDRWKPDLLINLGTCGGFEGKIERGAIILAEKTVVYDIIEQMGDFDAHILHYTTELDYSWLKEPFPHPVVRTLLVSGDRDLMVEDLPNLAERYGAAAGDWESGAIAWVARRNHSRLLILRGVTDLVGDSGGEAYGNLELFNIAADRIMGQLIDALPGWIRQSNSAV